MSMSKFEAFVITTTTAVWAWPCRIGSSYIAHKFLAALEVTDLSHVSDIVHSE